MNGEGIFRLILIVFATSGVILGAYYMLWMVQRVFFGPLNNEKNKKLNDLTIREMIVLLPFIIAVFWIGLYPKSYLNKMENSVAHYVELHQPEVLKQKLVVEPSEKEVHGEENDNVH